MDNQFILIIIALLTLVIVVTFFVILIMISNKNNEIIKQRLDEKKQQDLDLYNNFNNFENNILLNNSKNQNDLLKLTADSNKILNDDINKSLGILRDVYDKKLNDLLYANDTKLNQLINANELKLSSIQEGINQRLDTSLDEKLTKNFKSIGDSLNSLYDSLGVIKQLSSGVSDLQKTLANVKIGGNFGEAQLDMILGDMLSKDQYYSQFNLEQDPTLPQRKVDFVVKIPDKTTDAGVLYLPIDSKFNVVKFNNLIEAKNNYDTKQIEVATKEFKEAILIQAKSINEKYICPPLTTDFALMFLPSEALYAECMSIRELSDTVKSKFQVVIVGPMTVSAILKSFAIGFRYMKISDSAQKINDILIDIKNQYAKFTDDIKSLKKSLDTATDRTAKLEKRTNIINKKLTNISNTKIDIDSENLSLSDDIIDDDAIDI